MSLFKDGFPRLLLVVSLLRSRSNHIPTRFRYVFRPYILLYLSNILTPYVASLSGLTLFRQLVLTHRPIRTGIGNLRLEVRHSNHSATVPSSIFVCHNFYITKIDGFILRRHRCSRAADSRSLEFGFDASDYRKQRF